MSANKLKLLSDLINKADEYSDSLRTYFFNTYYDLEDYADFDDIFKKLMFLEYKDELTVEQLAIVWDYAYRDGHSDGYYEIEGYFDQYADFAVKILECK